MTQTVAPKFSSSLISWSRRPVGRLGVAILGVADRVGSMASLLRPHRPPEASPPCARPVSIYRIYSDDFAYIAASRNLERTLANLFVPHNTHIVPAWRVLTWALVAWAGSLEKIPEVLAEAAYGILVAVMLLTGPAGRARDRANRSGAGRDGRDGHDLGHRAFGVLVFGRPDIVGRLRHPGGSLVCPVLAAVALIRGTGPGRGLGHAGGLVLDDRPHRRTGRRGLPLARRPPEVALGGACTAGGDRSWRSRSGMFLGGDKIDSTVSFHGRTTSEAARPVEGFLHTAQAIPENLVLGNLGLDDEDDSDSRIDAHARPGRRLVRAALQARRAASVQPAGMHRRRGGAGQLPGGMDGARLLAVSVTQNHQHGGDRPLVRHGAADRGGSVRGRLACRAAWSGKQALRVLRPIRR